jgi:mitogen-activated protein kinase-activated protein kinase 2
MIGMKRRIKAGEYVFPEAEWSRVSQEAKDLIMGMLETIPEKRFTINDVMRSNWISVREHELKKKVKLKN